MKKDKFFENPVQKKGSLSQFFGNLTQQRKGSDPGVITLPKNNEKAKFSLTGLVKREIMQSTDDDLERELRATSSLVPLKDQEAPLTTRKGSFSSFNGLVSPRIFSARRGSNSDPSLKPSTTESPRPQKSSPFSKPITKTGVVGDSQKTKKLQESYKTLTPEQVIKEERRRFLLKNEFSPMIILQAIKCGKSILQDIEVVQIVHIEDMK